MRALIETVLVALLVTLAFAVLVMLALPGPAHSVPLPSPPVPLTLSCPRGSALYSYTSTAWGPTLACRPPHLAPAGAVEVEPVRR